MLHSGLKKTIKLKSTHWYASFSTHFISYLVKYSKTILRILVEDYK